MLLEKRSGSQMKRRQTLMTVVAAFVLFACVAVAQSSVAAAQPVQTAASVPSSRPTATPSPPPTVSPSPSPVTVNVNVPGDSVEKILWPSLLTLVGTLVAVAIGGVFTWVVATRGIWQKANEAEVDRRSADLEQFYGPFVRLLDVTYIMSMDLRKRIGDPEYRMLLKLTDANWLPSLSSGDRAIVDEVVANGQLLEALILEKSGGRVDDDVAQYLSVAVAHFRMMKHARAGVFIPADVDMLKRYVFPSRLSEVMPMQRAHVEARIAALRAAPDKAAPRYQPFVLPPEMKAPVWPDLQRGSSQPSPPAPTGGTTPTA
jgi:flagellar basal body-associated protein FliL